MFNEQWQTIIVILLTMATGGIVAVLLGIVIELIVRLFIWIYNDTNRLVLITFVVGALVTLYLMVVQFDMVNINIRFSGL